MFGRYPVACRSFDEFVEQMDQGRQRGKIHDHRDVTAYVPFADGEVDEEKQDYIAGLWRGGEAEEGSGISAQDFRQRHLEASVKHVRDRREATVEENVAGFGQRFLFQFDDVLER